MDEHEVLTIDEITAVMRNDTDRLERAQRSLSTARAEYQRMTGNATTEALREAAIQAYEPRLRQAEADVVVTAESVSINARQVITVLEAGRQPTLTAEELAAANAAREFVKEDAATLPPVELRDKMRAAVLAGDRAAMFLWLRYVPARQLEATGAPGEAGAIGEIRTLVTTMRQALADTRYDAPLREARTLLGQAVDLRTNARRHRSQEAAEAVVTRIMGGPGVPIPGAAA